MGARPSSHESPVGGASALVITKGGHSLKSCWENLDFLYFSMCYCLKNSSISFIYQVQKIMSHFQLQVL